MIAILKIALKELSKKKFYTFLLILVCMVSMNTVITSITNISSENYQQKIFERNLGTDMDNILHIHYSNLFETQESVDKIPKILQYISNLEGVQSVGQFERTGVLFEELKNREEYKEINQRLLQGTKYENHPERSDILFVDEGLLSLMKLGFNEYGKTEWDHLPIIVSEAFEDILPVGAVLSEERTQSVYEVVGYLPMGKQWVDQNDLIRFPLETMDGSFIAPFPPKDKTDILTQLSCLHNTYVIVDNADLDYLKTNIENYSLSHGFHVTANTISEEYDTYLNEVKIYISKQITLAVFISVMAVSSIVSVFTANAILKQRQYGIYLANGFTKKEIELGILSEILLLILPSTLVIWMGNLIQLAESNNIGIEMFRDVLVTAHLEYTLPICLILSFTVGIISSLLPVYKVSRYQPGELIGGLKNGIN